MKLIKTTIFLLFLSLFLLPQIVEAGCLQINRNYMLLSEPKTGEIKCIATYDTGKGCRNNTGDCIIGYKKIGRYHNTGYCNLSECNMARQEISNGGFCKLKTKNQCVTISNKVHPLISNVFDVNETSKDCIDSTKIYSNYDDCVQEKTLCGTDVCKNDEKCINKQCYISAGTCKDQTECNNKGGGKKTALCDITEEKCHLTGDAATEYKKNTAYSPFLSSKEIIKELESPKLAIRIPGLSFTEISDNATVIAGETFLNIPWISQYIGAIYKFALGVVSIVAVIMIIFQGFIILTSAGGDEKAAAIKQIVQVIVGLLLTWSSYIILYTINPDLVKFNSLKVKFIEPEGIDSMVFTKDDYYTTLGKDFKVPDNNSLDGLFNAYASCYGMSGGVLKAFAAIESGLNVKAGEGKKYQGLFQMSMGYCGEGLKLGKYPQILGLTCANRIHPEVNTAATAPTVNYNLKRIIKKCPNITVADAISLLYVGHNNGPGVMKHVINQVPKNGCTPGNIEAHVRGYYELRGGKSRGVDTNWGVKKYLYGKNKGVPAAQKYGVTELYPKNVNKELCPKTTKKRVLPN